MELCRCSYHGPLVNADLPHLFCPACAYCQLRIYGGLSMQREQNKALPTFTSEGQTVAQQVSHDNFTVSV